MGHATTGQGRSLALDPAPDDLPTHTAVHATELEHLLRDGVLRVALPPLQRAEYSGETPIEREGAVARWVALYDRARQLRAALRPGDGVGARQVQRAIRSLFLYEHQLTPKTRRQARTTLWRRDRAEALPQFAERRVQALYADRLSSGLSSSTVHHLHATLHKALKDAERLRLVARNVSTLVNVPRMAESEIHPLTAEEARTLLDVASGDRLYALYALALGTGMRQSEVLGLQWPELDLDAALVRVRWQLKREGGRWVWKQPKTRRSRRQIALSASTVAALRAHRAVQAEERLHIGPAWEDHELVFCTRLGRPLIARNIYRAFHAHLERGGLPTVRFNDLRHTAATLLLAGRVNPKVVSEMLGHATVAITLDIYSHVLPDMQQDAAATLEQVLYGS